jgi:hypothetical protein
VSVTITGQLGSTDFGAATWSGHATALEPLVAISLVRTATYFQWVKSEKYDPLAMEYTTLPLTLTLDPRPQPYHRQGRSVQLITLAVTCLTNVSGVSGLVDQSESVVQQMRSLPTSYQTQTGRLTPLIRTPEVSLGVVFFARRDVRYARKAIWHLRSTDLHLGNTDFLASLFSYRRTKTIFLGHNQAE